MTILIKRYANRKLYNTETSSYITLKGIGELVELGEDVRVVDNESGEDISSVTLSQILVDSERSARGVPQSVLSDLIQKGGDALFDAVKRGVGDASESIGDLQRNVRSAISTHEQDALNLRETWQSLRSEWRADFDASLQTALERVLGSLDLPRRSDIDTLNENLDRVARALEQQAKPQSKPRNGKRRAPSAD